MSDLDARIIWNFAVLFGDAPVHRDEWPAAERLVDEGMGWLGLETGTDRNWKLFTPNPAGKDQPYWSVMDRIGR